MAIRPRYQRVSIEDRSLRDQLEGNLETNFQELYSILGSVSEGQIFLPTSEPERSVQQELSTAYANAWFDTSTNELKITNPVTGTTVSVTLT